MVKATFIGNCQINGISQSFRVMIPDFTARVTQPADIPRLEFDPDTDLIFVQQEYVNRFLKAQLTLPPRSEVVIFPGMYFTAFHPDFVYAKHGAQRVHSPVGGITSAITLFAWKNGFTIGETIGLFRADVFKEVGYLDHWAPAAAKLLQDGRDCGLDLEDDLDQWRKSGCFLHSPNHPKIAVLSGLARALSKKLRITPRISFPENHIVDPLFHILVWPLYPEIAESFGLQGEYIFRGKMTPQDPAASCLDLERLITLSFEMWADKDPKQVVCDRFADPRMEQIFRFRHSKPKTKRAPNPYSDINGYQRWSKAVTAVDIDELDPVVHPKFKIRKADKVATAGSCFAQHISKALRESGYNYFVAESARGMSVSEAISRNYGVFSARYGNIYTTRQLVQLIDRTEGLFEPSEAFWRREDGRLVDPFRPQIEPDGFADVDALEASRREHLAEVGRLWRECDVFVFTLGLTEAWLNANDGAAFPLAPGVAGGVFDRRNHRFHNLTVQETTDELKQFLAKLRAINPSVRVILTVSPVPLIATAEDEHVLVSTTYSKAVLRVAAQEVSRNDPLVQYFPSFEIITGSYSKGRYFEPDARTVAADGVAHVMRVFMKHFSEAEATVAPANDALQREVEAGLKIICDEEQIEVAAG